MAEVRPPGGYADQVQSLSVGNALRVFQPPQLHHRLHHHHRRRRLRRIGLRPLQASSLRSQSRRDADATWAGGQSAGDRPATG